jgi:hypothetical protein
MVSNHTSTALIPMFKALYQSKLVNQGLKAVDQCFGAVWHVCIIPIPHSVPSPK